MKAANSSWPSPNGCRPTCARLIWLPAWAGTNSLFSLTDVRNRQEAIETAERVQRALMIPFKLDSQEIFVTASIGIAICGEGDLDPQHLLRDADTAMYRAKVARQRLHRGFRRVHARPSGGAVGSGNQPPAGTGPQRAVGALPTYRATRQRAYRWFRGPRALVQPRARHHQSQRFHSHGRRDGIDHPHRSVGAERGLRPSWWPGAMP